MIEITGLDKLQRQLEEAQRAFRALDGQLATVSFDPDRPESISAAIQTMEAAIDSKVAPYRNNPMIASIVPQLKEKYREAIRQRANSARSK
jgi:hypothetical protein